MSKSRVRSPLRYRHPNFVDIDFTCDYFCITQGELRIPAGYEWLSWLERLQVPLVFVGIWPIGVPVYTLVSSISTFGLDRSLQAYHRCITGDTA